MKRIAVTGANGFVGRHVVRHAVAEGYEVVGIVRSEPAAQVVREAGGDPVQLVGRDPEALVRALDGCRAVVHLAQVGAERGGQTYEAVNVGYTERVLEDARHAGVPRVVYFSGLGVARYGMCLRVLERLLPLQARRGDDPLPLRPRVRRLPALVRGGARRRLRAGGAAGPRGGGAGASRATARTACSRSPWRTPPRACSPRSSARRGRFRPSSTWSGPSRSPTGRSSSGSRASPPGTGRQVELRVRGFRSRRPIGGPAPAATRGCWPTSSTVCSATRSPTPRRSSRFSGARSCRSTSRSPWPCAGVRLPAILRRPARRGRGGGGLRAPRPRRRARALPPRGAGRRPRPAPPRRSAPAAWASPSSAPASPTPGWSGRSAGPRPASSGRRAARTTCACAPSSTRRDATAATRRAAASSSPRSARRPRSSRRARTCCATTASRASSSTTTCSRRASTSRASPGAYWAAEDAEIDGLPPAGRAGRVGAGVGRRLRASGRVRAVVAEVSGVSIETDEGPVRAGAALVATDGAIAELVPELQPALRPAAASRLRTRLLARAPSCPRRSGRPTAAWPGRPGRAGSFSPASAARKWKGKARSRPSPPAYPSRRPRPAAGRKRARSRPTACRSWAGCPADRSRWPAASAPSRPASPSPRRAGWRTPSSPGPIRPPTRCAPRGRPRLV